MNKEEIYNLLIEQIEQEQIKKDEPMKNHTNFKIGGNADFYVKAKDVSQIKYILKIAKENDIPFTILGNGSNVLVSDNGIRGIVIKVDIEKLEIEENEKENQVTSNNNTQIVDDEDKTAPVKTVTITVGAGEQLGKIAGVLAKNEIAGFEFAAGIPGSLGGAVYMNAGAYGGEMKDCIKSVTCLTTDGNIQKLSNEECDFSYRHSIFCENNFIILEAKLELPYGNSKEIRGKIEEYAISRKEKQPLMYPSAGSTFKRGADFITAKLIDECGLKGFTVGDAQVSNMHAGFVVNLGNATAKDVISVINHVKQVVLEKTGKQIELEVKLIGEF